MPARCLVVSNIPTPYRAHLFRVMHTAFAARGLEVEVVYLANTEAGRHWNVASSGLGFPSRTVPGVHCVVNHRTLHFNPGLLWSVLRRPPSWLIVGGSWLDPTVVSLVMLSRYISPRSVTYLWTEANAASVDRPRNATTWMRDAVVQRCDGFVVPGYEAEQALRSLRAKPDGRYLRLPNVVDERLFRDEVARLRRDRSVLRARMGLADSHRVLFWPARLHEATKGILNFLKVVAPELRNTRNTMFLIAGEGPDRAAIDAWIRNHLPVQARLLGHVSECEVLRLLAIADVLILPSLRDHNPLSIVEGLWAGLPLLVSRQCGNWREAVCAENGWVVDSRSPESLEQAFIAIARCPSEQLEDMGLRSLTVAHANFCTTTSVQRFVEALIA